MHFLRLVAVWWPAAQSARDNHLLPCNFAKYSPIKQKFSLEDSAMKLFYRAMLCIRGTSHGPVSVSVSVRLSVTSRSSTETAKHRITQTAPHDTRCYFNVRSKADISQLNLPHDTPKTLVCWCQRYARNSTGVTPYEGAECRWGGSKSATFDK